MKTIYLDHNATTPLHPSVLDAMRPYFSDRFANPASVTHEPGRQVRRDVESAREEVARFIGADPAEIVFTSGATESDNLALKGIAWANRERGNHIVASAIEHKAVLDSCEWLGRNGFRISLLPVDRNGFVDPDELRKALSGETILVSVMHANSEVGTIQPIDLIAAACRDRGVLFHTDATQSVGRVPFAITGSGCDLVSFSGHKFYGPKGIGALFIRKKVRIEALITGGGQEKGRRSGTLNVPGIIGLAAACRLATTDGASERARVESLRERLRQGIESEVEGAHLNGDPLLRLPNNLNYSFESVEGEALISAMKNVALSSGSACASGQTGPSHVLRAMGVPESLAYASVRFGLGRGNTAEEIDEVIASLKSAVAKLRALSPRS